jgi:hypothetical protein
VNDDTIRFETPEPHYTLFNNRRDGMPEVIVVIDALVGFPHNEIFPWHLRIELTATDLAEKPDANP